MQLAGLRVTRDDDGTLLAAVHDRGVGTEPQASPVFFRAVAQQAVILEDRSDAGPIESRRVAVGSAITGDCRQPKQAAQRLRHVLREVLLAVGELPAAIAGPGHEADRREQRNRVERSGGTAQYPGDPAGGRERSTTPQ